MLLPPPQRFVPPIIRVVPPCPDDGTTEPIVAELYVNTCEADMFTPLVVMTISTVSSTLKLSPMATTIFDVVKLITVAAIVPNMTLGVPR